jgi:hypothetical protein
MVGMVRILLVLAAVLLGMAVVAFVDAALTPRGETGVLPRWAWLVLVVVLPLVGPVLWWYAGRPRARTGAETVPPRDVVPERAGRPDRCPGDPRAADDVRLETMSPDERIAWLERELADLEDEDALADLEAAHEDTAASGQATREPPRDAFGGPGSHPGSAGSHADAPGSDATTRETQRPADASAAPRPHHDDERRDPRPGADR